MAVCLSASRLSSPSHSPAHPALLQPCRPPPSRPPLSLSRSRTALPASWGCLPRPLRRSPLAAPSPTSHAAWISSAVAICQRVLQDCKSPCPCRQSPFCGKQTVSFTLPLNLRRQPHVHARAVRILMNSKGLCRRALSGSAYSHWFMSKVLPASDLSFSQKAMQTKAHVVGALLGKTL